MASTDSTRLDPEKLDPAAMDGATYHRVVGPALQAAAEVAAKRGHKQLFDDMPAMLALIEMITRLADMHVDANTDTGTHAGLLESAATGACVMVFQEAKLPPESIGQLLAALETAYRQVHEQTVIDDARPFIAMAWSHLDDDERKEAQKCLQQATHSIITAIEAWQAQVH